MAYSELFLCVKSCHAEVYPGSASGHHLNATRTVAPVRTRKQVLSPMLLFTDLESVKYGLRFELSNHLSADPTSKREPIRFLKSSKSRTVRGLYVRDRPLVSVEPNGLMKSNFVNIIHDHFTYGQTYMKPRDLSQRSYLSGRACARACRCGQYSRSWRSAARFLALQRVKTATKWR